MVESGALEKRYAEDGIKGSNPFSSAKFVLMNGQSVFSYYIPGLLKIFELSARLILRFYFL